MRPTVRSPFEFVFFGTSAIPRPRRKNVANLSRGQISLVPCADGHRKAARRLTSSSAKRQTGPKKPTKFSRAYLSKISLENFHVFDGKIRCARRFGTRPNYEHGNFSRINALTLQDFGAAAFFRPVRFQPKDASHKVAAGGFQRPSRSNKKFWADRPCSPRKSHPRSPIC
jgi:hypothetical protein